MYMYSIIDGPMTDIGCFWQKMCKTDYFFYFILTSVSALFLDGISRVKIDFFIFFP